MDIFNFINSRDIHEHLRGLNYPFTPLEAAWLIWQSKNITIEERHQAWQEIIGTLPDCPIEDRPNTIFHDSLHEYLRQLIRVEDKLMKQFMSDDKEAVYTYRYCESGYDKWIEEYERLYASYSNCIDAIAAKDHKEHPIRSIQSRKVWIGDIRPSLTAEMRPGNRIYSISGGTLTENERDLIEFGFGGMWFAFPTPFVKGDILQSCRDDEYPGRHYCDRPFVMDAISPNSPHAQQQKQTGDYTDMNAWGYYQNSETGVLYAEVMSCYMDLEYYRGELTAKQRVLKALHNFMKGKMDICLYSRAYHFILTEEYASDLRPLYYNHIGMALAGMDAEEQERWHEV